MTIAKSSSKNLMKNKQLVYIGIVAVVIVILGVVIGSGALSGLGVRSTQPSQITGSEEQTSGISGVGETKIILVNYPSRATTASSLTFTWSVDSGEKIDIDHTAVHYGTTSVPNPTGPGDYSKASTVQSGEIPGTFSTSFAIQTPGTYYFRAHAIVGGKHVWGEERSIIVTQPSASTTVKEMRINADDKGFYTVDGDKITSINVKFGEKWRITFKTLTTNVYYGGLEYKSEQYNFATGKVAPGKETEVEITALEDGEIKSYWPSSDVLKSTLQVNVA